MKEIDVVVGCYYAAKVSGRVVVVRVDEIIPRLSGLNFNVVNLRTDRALRLTARRLRKRLSGGEMGAPLT